MGSYNHLALFGQNMLEPSRTCLDIQALRIIIENAQMCVHSFGQADIFREHHYGIPEPRAQQSKRLHTYAEPTVWVPWRMRWRVLLPYLNMVWLQDVLIRARADLKLRVISPFRVSEHIVALDCLFSCIFLLGFRQVHWQSSVCLTPFRS